MSEVKEIKKEDKVEETVVTETIVADAVKTEEKKSETSDVKVAPARVPFKKNFNNNRRRKKFSKPRSEFDQKIIKIRRVTRVMSGGRRFSFSVAMVLGDKKGRVGVGIAKANDTALAIEKAVKRAKRNMVTLKLTNTNSIPYDVSNKYCASVVQILPTKEGQGVSAGSAAKVVLELAGIKDVTAKILSRSKNQLNIAMATVEALDDFKVKQ